MANEPQSEQDSTRYSGFPFQALEVSLDSLDRNMSIHEITKKLLGNQLAVTIEAIPGIHAGEDIEAVHKTRVGFRRIRSQLRILKPLFKKKVLQSFRTNSKLIGQVLGTVRDLDVLHIYLSSAFQEHAPAENFQTAIWKPFFIDQYLKAQDQLLGQLESEQFSEFIQSFYNFCKDIELGAKQPEKVIEKGFPTLKSYVSSMLINQFQNVQIRQQALSEQPIDTNFHKLRIEVKRFRYILDFFTPILKVAPTLDLINSLTNLQDNLGIINDHVTAERIIGPLLEKNSPLRDHNMAVFLSEYSKKISLENDALQASFHHSWKTFQKSNPESILQNCFSEIEI